MNTENLINQISQDMSTMGPDPCVDCHCYGVCQEVGGETLCGVLRSYYR